MGEADRRDLLEKAEQNAVRHLQVRYITEIFIFSSMSPRKELRPLLKPDHLCVHLGVESPRYTLIRSALGLGGVFPSEGAVPSLQQSDAQRWLR